MSRYSSVSAFELGVIQQQQKQKEETEMKTTKLTISDPEHDVTLVVTEADGYVNLGMYEEDDPDGGLGMRLTVETASWLIGFLEGYITGVEGYITGERS